MRAWSFRKDNVFTFSAPCSTAQGAAIFDWSQIIPIELETDRAIGGKWNGFAPFSYRSRSSRCKTKRGRNASSPCEVWMKLLCSLVTFSYAQLCCRADCSFRAHRVPGVTGWRSGQIDNFSFPARTDNRFDRFDWWSCWSFFVVVSFVFFRLLCCGRLVLICRVCCFLFEFLQVFRLNLAESGMHNRGHIRNERRMAAIVAFRSLALSLSLSILLKAAW